MAASPKNLLRLDVLRHGRGSAYAGLFDIDLSQDRLLLLILGKNFYEVLVVGELMLGCERTRPMLHYFDRTFPLDSPQARTTISWITAAKDTRSDNRYGSLGIRGLIA